jgi:hypothetical protein
VSQVVEVAVSLNYRVRSDQPGVVRHVPTGNTLKDSELDTKIAIYEDRVFGWFLRVAHELRNKDGNSGYVVLQIALSQIEGIELFKEGTVGEAPSKKTFVDSLMKMFTIPAQHRTQIESFYRAVRCGLFHVGFTKDNVAISSTYSHDFGVAHDSSIIEINPWKFLDAVTAYTQQYVADLKNPANVALRENFRKRWDAGHT